jgi:threonine dehydrogenase-like Zn-dependent dehydrogenase
MRALTVRPGVAGSGALSELPEPSSDEGSVLVAARVVGVCGTDREILAGEYGSAPDGDELLVLGHESLGEVLEAPAGSGFTPGDLVVGVVRRADPVPCASCAAGEFDMCRNGGFTEHGIQGRHGFARERWRADPDQLVRVDPSLDERGVLLEPTSVVAKAWEHTERIGARGVWQPETVLVTGAGPVGLLAALLGVQRGLGRARARPRQRRTEARPGRAARRHLPLRRRRAAGPGTGRGHGVHRSTARHRRGHRRHRPRRRRLPHRRLQRRRQHRLDLGGLNREWVLQNDVVFGSVNANRRHYALAADALAAADAAWLDGLITRRVPVEEHPDALEARDGDVKTVLVF